MMCRLDANALRSSEAISIWIPNAMRNKAADGLRGLAALNVALSHFVWSMWPALLRMNAAGQEMNPQPMSRLETILSSPPTTLFFNGNFPVLIFFVLSGFVLAQPAIASNQKGLRSRAWGRYFRLNIPIATAVMLSWGIFALGFYHAQELPLVTGSKWIMPYFKSNVSFFEAVKAAVYGGVTGDWMLDPPLWTLRIEFVGSMMLLATLALAPPHAFGAIAALVACAVGIFACGLSDEVFLLCFLVGAVLNWIPISRFWSRVLLVIGLVLGAYQSYGNFYRWLPKFADEKTCYEALGAMLLVYAVCRAGIARTLLEHRIPQYLGRISYSLYLLHVPILCSLICYMVVKMGNSPLILAISISCYLAVCFAVSSVFTTVVDAAAIKMGHWFANLIEGGGGVPAINIAGRRTAGHAKAPTHPL